MKDKTITTFVIGCIITTVAAIAFLAGCTPKETSPYQASFRECVDDTGTMKRGVECSDVRGVILAEAGDE